MLPTGARERGRGGLWEDDMDFETLRYDVEGHVAYVTLNRPEKLALTMRPGRWTVACRRPG
jgi:hypothetical protein